MVKKVIQQGHSRFDARSVRLVREHDKRTRTPLVAFFNIPMFEDSLSSADEQGSGHEGCNGAVLWGRGFWGTLCILE